MKLAIVGSRDFTDYRRLSRIIDKVKGEITLIVSGGARGADTLGERYAKEKAIPYLIFPANWDKYGKQAGILRNQDIVDNADAMVAFLAPESKGTRDSIKRAQAKNIPIHIVNIFSYRILDYVGDIFDLPLAFEIAGRVALQPATGNGIAKYGTTALQNSGRQVQRASVFDHAQHVK